MKKNLCILLVSCAILGSVFAVPTKYNESNPENWTTMSYVNIPILKILDSKDGYVVIYQKNKYGVGQTVIPKKWAKGTAEEPRKLKIRNITGGKIKPFMTVVKDDGNFNKVILTVPQNKRDAFWGIVERGKSIDGIDKDSLEEIQL